MKPHEKEFEERKEREPLGRPVQPAPDDRPRGKPETAKEIDRDHDGLPDEPAKYRVPS